MVDNYKIGKISTTVIYLLEGIITFIVVLISHSFSVRGIAVGAFCWGLSAVVLMLLQSLTGRMVFWCWMCEMLFTTLMVLLLADVLHNPHLIYLLFFVQWMSNLLYLKKKVCLLLLAFHMVAIAAETFALKAIGGGEFVCALITLTAGCWFATKLIEMADRQKQQNLEHQQSLDDMMKLVEVKYEEAQTANKAKSSFLANMSHEIRTPINTVLGLDTMILRESKEEAVRKYALDIQSAGHSLLSIINDILDFSKIESGKMEIIPVDYDLSSLIHDVCNMISPKADAKGLQFIVKVDNTMPSRLLGDDVRIRQILINLLTNAVKYTHEGSVTFSVCAEKKGNNVLMHFLVEDTGIGIKEESLQLLFSKFVRIEEERNRNIEGTGLGINIVTQLLMLMGSELRVESVYGKGSKFYFDLIQEITNPEPIEDLERRIREQNIDYQYTTEFTIPDVRLLVVDDNPMNRLVFCELLKTLACEIDQAESGKQCLELTKCSKYDIIFMDHMMPEMDGIETFKQMRQGTDNLNTDTPVIILTANAIAGAREQYLEEGFDDYLSKPINPDKLEKMIASIIPNEKKKLGNAVTGDISGNRPKEEAKSLPEVEGVDWDYARMKLKTDTLVMGVVKDFSVTAEHELQILQNMYAQIPCEHDTDASEKAFKQYRIKVHAMKSTCAMFGAMGVSALAKLLEYAARDLDGQTIDTLMPIFVREWKQMKERIDEAFGFGEPEEDAMNGSIEPDTLKKYLDMLAAAMDELDVDTADAIMEELHGYSYEKAQQELIRELDIAVRNLDTDTAIAFIEKLSAK